MGAVPFLFNKLGEFLVVGNLASDHKGIAKKEHFGHVGLYLFVDDKSIFSIGSFSVSLISVQFHRTGLTYLVVAFINDLVGRTFEPTKKERIKSRNSEQ